VDDQTVVVRVELDLAERHQREMRTRGGRVAFAPITADRALNSERLGSPEG
jgi:hypothetical protein